MFRFICDLVQRVEGPKRWIVTHLCGSLLFAQSVDEARAIQRQIYDARTQRIKMATATDGPGVWFDYQPNPRRKAGNLIHPLDESKFRWLTASGVSANGCGLFQTTSGRE
jgi:hypothetical protein